MSAFSALPDAIAQPGAAVSALKRAYAVAPDEVRLCLQTRQLAAESLGTAWSAYSEQAVRRAQDATQALTLWLASPEFMRR